MDFTGCISGSTRAVMIRNSSVSSLALFLGNGASSVGFQAIDTKRDCYNTLPIISNSAFVPTFGLAFLAACELIIQSAQSELADNDHASSVLMLVYALWFDGKLPSKYPPEILFQDRLAFDLRDCAARINDPLVSPEAVAARVRLIMACRIPWLSGRPAPRRSIH